MLSALWPQWDGIWRPPELGSSAAPTAESSISVGVMPRLRQSARSRWEKDSLLRPAQKLRQAAEVVRGGADVGVVPHEELVARVGPPPHLGDAEREVAPDPRGEHGVRLRSHVEAAPDPFQEWIHEL